MSVSEHAPASGRGDRDFGCQETRKAFRKVSKGPGITCGTYLYSPPSFLSFGEGGGEG